MIGKMRETERIRSVELGRPFSVISSNPKYNADYLENIIKTKWLRKLEEMEKQHLICKKGGDSDDQRAFGAIPRHLRGD